MATHYDIVRRDIVDSTQDVASERFAETGVPVLVLAGRQVGGRGRQGRTWVEPDRAMYSSLAFESDWDPARLPVLSLCVGVAVRRALRSLGVTVDLKWPNDLLIGDAKVGGILVEASGQTVTAGCGVNLVWDRPVELAGALFDVLPDDDFAASLAVRWADEFVAIATAPPDAWPVDEYRAACVTLGAAVSWDGGEGLATDITDDGALVVDTPDGRTEITQGDVHLHRRG